MVSVTLIDHRIDVKTFQTLVSLQTFKYLDFFLWSIRVQTGANWCWFAFYNNVDSFGPFQLKFFGKLCTWEKNKCITITSVPWCVLLSNITLFTNWSMREKLLSYGYLVYCHFSLFTEISPILMAGLFQEALLLATKESNSWRQPLMWKGHCHFTCIILCSRWGIFLRSLVTE